MAVAFISIPRRMHSTRQMASANHHLTDAWFLSSLKPFLNLMDILIRQFITQYREEHHPLLTLRARQMVRRIVQTNIPMSPVRCRVFRPAFSTRISEMTVMNTFMMPMPRVAYCAFSSFKPAVLKISVEKKIACKSTRRETQRRPPQTAEDDRRPPRHLHN